MLFFFLLGLLPAAGGENGRKTGAGTPLDRYVSKADPSYAHEVLLEKKGPGFTFFVLGLTSQTWRSEKDVDRPRWVHHLNVIIPEKVGSDIGLLAISGGSNGREPREEWREEYAQFALLTGTVVTELREVPNQPLRYGGEQEGRKEDASIAYTWDRYLRSGDEEWPLQLPMTKSAVKAMDAVSEFAASARAGGHAVERFVVAGASKRGWTTWLTAAVDKRVVAIAPIVIDMLNVEESFEHHYRAYGFFAPAVSDYEEMQIMDWMGSKEYGALLKMVEPFEYRERFTMPKYIVNATGDQFFLPDSHRFYFEELPGEKFVRYVPNADHSLRETDAWQGLLSWYQAVVAERERPVFSWSVTENGEIRVEVEEKPLEVKLWRATNPEARDFRVATIGRSWKASILPPAEAGPWAYIAKVEEPPRGFTAFLVELKFRGPSTLPLIFSTGVAVLPDRLPFEPYVAKEIKR